MRALARERFQGKVIVTSRLMRAGYVADRVDHREDDQPKVVPMPTCVNAARRCRNW